MGIHISKTSSSIAKGELLVGRGGNRVSERVLQLAPSLTSLSDLIWGWGSGRKDEHAVLDFPPHTHGKQQINDRRNHFKCCLAV